LRPLHPTFNPDKSGQHSKSIESAHACANNLY
jgi:hypothetical protein